MQLSEAVELTALSHRKGHYLLRFFFLCCFNSLALLYLRCFFRQILLHSRQILRKGSGLFCIDRIDIKLYCTKEHPLIMQDIEEIILPLTSGIGHHHIKV